MIVTQDGHSVDEILDFFSRYGEKWDGKEAPKPAADSISQARTIIPKLEYFECTMNIDLNRFGYVQISFADGPLCASDVSITFNPDFIKWKSNVSFYSDENIFYGRFDIERLNALIIISYNDPNNPNLDNVHNDVVAGMLYESNFNHVVLCQYLNLRKWFSVLIEHILGPGYYNMGMDVYTCDEFSCEDIAYAFKEPKHRNIVYLILAAISIVAVAILIFYFYK